MATKKISNINDELDIKLFLFITKKCLIYIILFLGVAALSSFLYLRYTPPIYSTSAVIQISSNEENVSKILETKDVVEGQNDLEKAREFISSGVFLGQVFSKLPLSTSYYYEGRILSNEQWHGSAPYEVDANVKILPFMASQFILSSVIKINILFHTLYLELQNLKKNTI